jgi:hypothetical protein
MGHRSLRGFANKNLGFEQDSWLEEIQYPRREASNHFTQKIFWDGHGRHFGAEYEGETARKSTTWDLP